MWSVGAFPACIFFCKPLTFTPSGIAIGSEMSGGVENVRIENCHFHRPAAGVRLKTAFGRGGFIRNVKFENVTITDFGYMGVGIGEDYGSLNPGCPVPDVSDLSFLPEVSGISFKNVNMSMVVGGAGGALETLESGADEDGYNKPHEKVGGSFVGLAKYAGPEGKGKGVIRDLRLEGVEVRVRAGIPVWTCDAVQGVARGVTPEICPELAGGRREFMGGVVSSRGGVGDKVVAGAGEMMLVYV